MVEAGATGVTKKKCLEAIEFGHDCCKQDRRRHPRTVVKAGKTKEQFHATAGQRRTCSTRSRQRSRGTERRVEHGEVRQDSRATSASTKQRRSPSALFPEEQKTEARKVFDASEGADFPR